MSPRVIQQVGETHYLAQSGTVGDLLGPWLVRYVTASCARIIVLAWLDQAAGFLVMAGVGGRECFAPAR